MQNIKKYFMTLALLITAVTGAWADYTVTWEGTTLQGIAVSSNSVHTPNTTQTVEGITVTASNGDFFYLTTYPKGPVVIAQSSADNGLVFSAENNIKSIAITFTESAYYGGSMAIGAGAHTYQVSPAAKSFALPKNDLFIGITKVVFTLEGDAAIELKPDETGKKWILADMPASNIELQVEYYPESYLFLSKDALKDKASIAVTAGDLGVQFGEDGKSANPVAEGTAMTVKYNGTKKVLGMKVTKKVSLAYPIALSAVTSDYIGSVVTTDGNVYATVAAATAASKTPVAMIAYVGTESDCALGLAIALADESGTKDYEAAGTACIGKIAVTGGTWRLPSQKDWEYMLIGCGSSTSTMSNSGLASKLTTAQGDALQTSYWSSTEYTFAGTTYALQVFFEDSNARFGAEFKSGLCQVRGCLAF